MPNTPANTAISIVVPTLNEADNILTLLDRIKLTMEAANVTYEVIFIDDHSTDNTREVIKSVQDQYPIRLQTKIGKRGKANSLKQGFGLARYDIIGMIDADLQYPPEAIAPMLALLRDYNSDIIITNRVSHDTSALRRLTSTVFNYVFVRLLFGFNYDTQSGLKIFRASVLDNINLTPRKWSFDLEFIVRALEMNYKILQYDIPFARRLSGETKLNVVSSTYEFVTQSVKLRANSSGKALRQAYRMNVSFMNQALSMLAVIIIACTFVGGHSAAALKLPNLNSKKADSSLSSTLQTITNIVNPSKSDNSDASSTTSPTPVVSLPVQLPINTPVTTEPAPTTGPVVTTPMTTSTPATSTQPTVQSQPDASVTSTSATTGSTASKPLTVSAGTVLAAQTTKIVYPASTGPTTGKSLYANEAASTSSVGANLAKAVTVLGIIALSVSYFIGRRLRHEEPANG